MTEPKPKRFAKKSLGQNFLVDQGAIQEIVHEVPENSPLVLEIGPGRGAISPYLAKRAQNFAILEKDDDLFPGIVEKIDHPNFFPFHGDALKFDFELLWQKTNLATSAPLIVAANLPYNIATEILFRLLFLHARIPLMVLMFQKEVGERLAAPSGSKTYGAISVAAQNHYAVEIIRVLKPGAFRPQPKVNSVVLRFARKASPAIATNSVSELSTLHKLVGSAFRHRRKTVENSLMIELKLPRAEITKLLQSARIEPSARAESLTLSDFDRLFQAYSRATLKTSHE